MKGARVGIDVDLEITIALEDSIKRNLVRMAAGHQFDAYGRSVGRERRQGAEQQQKYLHIRFRSYRRRLRMGQFGRQ